jgi:hypothetical protein
MPTKRTPARAAPKVTSAGGGIAGKLGERYEAWWTIFEGVLPVLDGHFGALCVEEPGSDAIEFRVIGRADGGLDEAHQCKNSDGTSWTVARLRNEGFLVELARQADLGRRVVFVSSSSSVLARMAKKARRLTFASWEADLNDKEEAASKELQRDWSTTADIVHRRLRLTEFRTIDDETLRDVVVGQIDRTMEGDPEEAIGLIRSHVEQHLGEHQITAHELWSVLREKGHHPHAGINTAVSEALREVVHNYVEQVDSSRPPALPLLQRAEVDRVTERLTAEDGPTVVAVVGQPGSGKSSVLTQVCRRLANDVVIGVLRLDLASPATTAAQLGKQEAIGFGDAPTIAMARAGAGMGAVLVIDQIDSVSRLSGRDPSLLLALRQVVSQARAAKDLRLLVACRSEDLRYDSSLRRALGLSPLDMARKPGEPREGQIVPDSEIEQIVLGDLPDGEVASVLHGLGLDYDRSPRVLRRLLGNALNLALFTELYSEADESGREPLTAVRTKLDLVAEYHDHVSRQLRNSPGGTSYAGAAIRLATHMSDQGMLSAPESVLADLPDTKDLMIHHGVIIKEGRRLRFVHETLLEYLVATGIRQAGTTVAQLLAEGPQELLRSGQVRALLALGKEEDDGREYVSDLRVSLDGTRTRSHIRAAVYSMLRECRTVTDSEFAVVFERAMDPGDRLRFHALRTLTAPAFAAIMAQRSLPQFLAMRLSANPPAPQSQDEQTLARLSDGETSNLLVWLARSSPETTAASVRPLASDAAALGHTVRLLLRIVFMAGPTDDGRGVADLFITVVESVAELATSPLPANFVDAAIAYGLPDANALVWRIVDLTFNDDGRHALSTIVKNCALHAARAIGAWLRAAERISLHHNISSLFQGFGEDTPLRHESTGLKILELCARATPIDYVTTLLPILIRDWERTVLVGADWRPVGVPDSIPGLRTVSGMFSYGRRSLYEEIIDALHLALNLAAHADATELRQTLRPLHGSDLFPVHETLAFAYEHAFGPIVVDALEWCTDPRVHGLDRYITCGWAWGAVLSQIAAVGDSRQRAAVFELIAASYPPAGVSARAARESLPPGGGDLLVILGQLSRRLGTELPAALSEDLRALERIAGPPPTTAKPQGVEFTTRSPAVPPPTVDSADQEWIDAINALAPVGDNSASDDDSGHYDVDDASVGAMAVALHDQAQKSPIRFARILLVSTGAYARLTSAIVGGIVEAANTIDEADHEIVIELITTLEARGPAERNDMDTVRLILRCAAWQLPRNVLDLVPRVFMRSPTTTRDVDWDSGDRSVVTGLNHARGLAANAVGALLQFPRHRTERLDVLRQMIDLVANDPDDSVRVFAPQAVLPLLSEDPQMFERTIRTWLSTANDAVMYAPNLGRVIWAASSINPILARDLVRRLLTSVDPIIRQRGGNLAALFAVKAVSLDVDDDPYCLAAALCDVHARRGAAEFLAQLVDELSTQEADSPGNPLARANVELLYRLADDDDDDVCSHVMNVLRHTTAPLLQHSELLRRLARSRAFVSHPASILVVLRNRRDEMPESVLDLCESWVDAWVETAGDISKREAADGYYITEIVLAIYAHAAPGGAVRRRCLDIADRLIEKAVGSAEAKIEHAAYQAITTDPHPEGFSTFLSC